MVFKQVDVSDLNDFTACTECLDVRMRIVRSHMHLCCCPMWLSFFILV